MHAEPPSGLRPGPRSTTLAALWAIGETRPLSDTKESAVTRLISTLTVIWALGTGMAWAQAYPPNEAGVTMGHWHLNTRNIEANKKSS